MPFVSQAQRGYMYANHPEMAEEFEDATPKGKQLPYKLHPGKGRKDRRRFRRGSDDGEKHKMLGVRYE